MSESDHEWCRDVQRDEAIRAAEDAAAVPSIQHRDLPEQVALLWASLGDIIGRVVRLEGEMDAGQDEEASPAVCDSASPAEGLRTEGWLTAEEREAVEMFIRMGEEHDDVDAECRAAMKLRGLLARSTPPRVKVPAWLHADVRGVVADAIRAAGGEVDG